MLYAFYNHPSKWHSATARVINTVINKNTVAREAKSDAPPGVWAVAYVKSGLFGGDETFYNSW